jgi:hypothetical protein
VMTPSPSLRANGAAGQPLLPLENPKENQDLGQHDANRVSQFDTEQNAKIPEKYPGSREKSGDSVRDVFTGTGRPRVNSTHSHAERGLDAYWTPPEAVTALLRIEQVPKSVIDPACGSGAILDALRAAGRSVYGCDVVDYGWEGTVAFSPGRSSHFAMSRSSLLLIASRRSLWREHSKVVPGLPPFCCG